MIRIRIRLSTLLGERRMKQSELAKLTGIAPATINHYYQENVEVLRIDYIIMMCEALKCHLSDLIVEEEVPDGVSAIDEYRAYREYVKKAKDKGRR